MSASAALAGIGLDLAPLLPWPAVAALGLIGLALVGLGLWRRARGIWWRALAVAVLTLALLNPSLVREERAPLDDIAVVLVDESPSQGIEPRAAQTAAALAEVERRIGALDGVSLRVVRAGADAGGGDGTRLFTALARALADVPSRRLAGVVAITDGQVHDAPADLAELGFDAPVHVLLSGRPDEGDRRLHLAEAPSFGLVGKEVVLTVRVDDLPEAAGPGSAGGFAEASAGQARVRVQHDGEPLGTMTVPVGVDTEVAFVLDHGGPSVFEIDVEPGPRELSLANNRAAVVVNGVRDRLRVLLVSGEPYPGERSWRNLLKADPAVDLVHFTILRPPEKQDGTPINELSLIAFPIRELFDIKLDEFDLIIFDRYRRRGILPRAYYENIARYVEGGGALLESAGPAFAGPLSLFQSPLGRVLPAEPTGEVIERGYRPAVSDVGRRHPVTAELSGAGAAEPGWGRWLRQIVAIPRRGVTVLNGVDGRPLLVLDRFGEGRVAQLLSDQIWLWGRGYDGGGPQAELLRRIAHWLMKEPELEEEDLRATVIQGRLEVTRRSLSEGAATVEVVSPGGGVRDLALAESGAGRAGGALAADETGLYRVTDGARTAFAASGPLNPLEFTDLRASPDLLLPIVEATGGAVHRLAGGTVPELRKVRPGRDTAGSGWIGLRANGDYVVTGIASAPLLPALGVLLAGLGALLLAWRREGR